MKTDDIKTFLIETLTATENPEPFRPAYERRKGMTKANRIGQEPYSEVQRTSGGMVMVMQGHRPVYDESTRRPIWPDLTAYATEHIVKLRELGQSKSKIKWAVTRLWRKKIGNQIVRLFSVYGLYDCLVAVIEEDERIVRIEYYDTGYDSRLPNVPSIPDLQTSNDFYNGRIKTDTLGVEPFYAVDFPA